MSLLPPWRRSFGLRRIRFGRHPRWACRFRSDFVVAEHPHEYILVDGLPGVVEQRRNALDIAELRAFPGNDDQSLVRLLVAENRHTERLSSGDIDQLSVFVLPGFRVVSRLCRFCFRLYPDGFRLDLRNFRLFLLLSSYRQGREGTQEAQEAKEA